MVVKLEYTEKELKHLVYRDIKEKLNLSEVKEDDVKIMVKSKQNYKSEWEEASFKAEINKHVI